MSKAEKSFGDKVLD